MSSTASSLAGIKTSGSEERADGKLPWMVTVVAVIVAAVGLGTYRWYQNTYSFSVGMDSFEPEFQVYWMRLLYWQLAIIILAGGGYNAYLWLTRPAADDVMSPIEEFNIYKRILAIMAAVGIIAPTAIMLFMEADAAWHQITIRDTDFTPTHIGLFYFFMPLMVAGIFTAFMWMHTRLPDFRDRISLPMGILLMGPVLIMPNVGFNEWGHTFFYAEELFAAPIHWGFVALGWGFFGVTGFMVQIMSRMAKLVRLTGPEASA